jgi:hypothetical protein
MSSRRALMRVVGCVVVYGVASAGCSSSSGAVGTRDVAPSDIGAATAATASVATACAGFEQRYVGGGLTVDLPTDVAQASGGATSDPGPVHASESHDFMIESSTVTVGRRIGSAVVSEPLVSERVSNGVVLYATASNEELRACLLASMLYDRGEDLRDE